MQRRPTSVVRSEMKFLHVRVVEGRKLASKDISGKSDPYCVVHLAGNKSFRTDTVRQNLSPQWCETASSGVFAVREESKELWVEIYDWDRMSSDDFMGQVKVPLSSLEPGVEMDVWIKLEKDLVRFKKEKVSGEIRLVLKFEDLCKRVDHAGCQDEAAGWPGVDDAKVPRPHVQSCSSHSWYSALISVEQDLFVWGQRGACGLDLPHDGLRPVRVCPQFKFKSVNVGDVHFGAITNDDNLVMWGSGENGRLGLGSTKLVREGVIVPSFGSGGVKQVSCGYRSTAALDMSGHLFVWGCNATGQLGLEVGAGSVDRLVPTPASPELVFSKVSMGNAHMLALTEDGRVMSCGFVAFGRLGLGEQNDGGICVGRLTHVSGVAGRSVDISAGDLHSLCVTEDGALFSWGFNNAGRLGLGDCASRWMPNRVLDLSSVKIVSCCAGRGSSLALDEDGRVWVWGNRCGGHLGPPLTRSDMPALVPEVVKELEGRKIHSVAIGVTHCVAVGDRACVYSWGTGNAALGHGNPRVPLAFPVVRGPRRVMILHHVGSASSPLSVAAPVKS